MESKRGEPYLQALRHLRERLREAHYPFEQRLTATEVAEELGLSPTPVREALSRLAGEGLLEERRGQGYFVRRPGATDVADLYRMSEATLLIALEPRGIARPLAEGDASRQALPLDAPAAVRRVEQLFDRWVVEAGGWALAQAHRRIQLRLAPIRRFEPLVIGDLPEEASQLLGITGSAAGPARTSAVRAFHRRRVRLASHLAMALESGRPPPSIEPI